MPDATGNSLVMAGAFGSFDLLGNPNWRISAGTKWDLGAAQPDISVVIGTLLSGDRVSGSRSGNRTIVLPLLLTGADRVTVAANLNPILRTVDCQPPNESFTLTWTPAGGLPVTFDCYRGSYQRSRSLSVENAGGTLVTLTFAAAPFGRSNVVVNVAAASPQLQIDSLNTAPTNATLDTTTKYEGTGAADVATTRRSQSSSRGTSYWYDTPSVFRTITSVDLTAYASIGHRFRWPAPLIGAPWTAIVTLTVSDGTHSASASVAVNCPGNSLAWQLVFVPIADLSSGVGFGGGSPPPMPNLAAITKWTWAMSTVPQTLAFAPTASPPAVTIDDIRLFPASSTAISTGTGAVLTIPAVIGTAPAPASLTVTEGGGSMTNLLLHHPPVDQSPDAAILAAFTGTTPRNSTIAAANNTFRGTYSVVLLLGTVGSGARTVSVQFDHKQGSTVLASQTVSTAYSTPTGKFAIMRDYITLPLVPVPDENTTDTLVITVTTTGGTTPDTFTDVALADNRGQLAILGSLPSGTKTVYIDEPDPIGELGQIYASATDRTAATGQLGWGGQTRIGHGPLILEPGDNRLLAASPDGVVPTITLTYDPRWLDERDM